MEYIWLKLLAYILFSIATYWFTNNRLATYNWTLPIDRKINMVPIFVIPYIFLYPFIFIVFFIALTFNKNIADDYLNTLIIVQLLAFIFWFFFPNGVRRTPAQPTGFGKMINFIYKHDDDANGFPSGHVFITVISMYFAFFVSTPFGIFMTALGSLIILSTLLIKQHYSIDVIGGIL